MGKLAPSFGIVSAIPSVTIRAQRICQPRRHDASSLSLHPSDNPCPVTQHQDHNDHLGANDHGVSPGGTPNVKPRIEPFVAASRMRVAANMDAVPHGVIGCIVVINVEDTTSYRGRWYSEAAHQADPSRSESRCWGAITHARRRVLTDY